MRVLEWILLLTLLSPVQGYGTPRKSAGKTLGITGPKTIEKPLEVTGQTRTLSMMLVLKNKRDRVKFINIREDYTQQILGTVY